MPEPIATILLAVKLVTRVSNACLSSWPFLHCLSLDKIAFCTCFTVLSEFLFVLISSFFPKLLMHISE